MTIATQGLRYVPGPAIIPKNRHLAKTTTNDERDVFRGPDTMILFSAAFLVLTVVSLKNC